MQFFSSSSSSSTMLFFTALVLLVTITSSCSFFIAMITAQQKFTNYRVTPGLGSRSEHSVRITAVTPTVTPTATPVSSEFSSFFSYAEPFKYRWPQNKVFTTLKTVIPGPSANEFSIGRPGTDEFIQMNISVPALGQGVRGIMTADLCIQTDFANCETSVEEHLNVRLPTLFNTVMQNEHDLNFISILGDVLYDGNGVITPEFFNNLSASFKNKFVLTAVGNYDLWSEGDPAKIHRKHDSLGNFFMQQYGMDSMASKNDPDNQPFNFSVNPDEVPHGSKLHDYLAATDNFLTYTAIGNIGFIIADGAVHRHHMEPFFQEACAWFDTKKSEISRIFVMSHWVENTGGCASNATTTYELYQYIIDTYGTAGCPSTKVRYFTGHHHCNAKLGQTGGAIVGGFGKSNAHCRNFGLPFVSTMNGRFLVAYFPILHNDETTEMDRLKARKLKAIKTNSIFYPKKDHFRYQHLVGSATKRYEALIACASLPSGLSACVENPTVEVEIWFNESLI